MSAPPGNPPEPLTRGEALRARFLADIEGLDTRQWTAIARGFAAEQAMLARNRARIARAINDYITARLADTRCYQEHAAAFNRWASARLAAAVQKLPELVSDDGASLSLRSAAAAAARTAEASLRLFEEGIAPRVAALAAPALRPFAGFVALPGPLSERPAAGNPSQRRKLAAAGPSAAPTAFHIRFPDGYFTYDEPLPAGVEIAPWGWNHRSTHHETWSLDPCTDAACRFGGSQAGHCATCGRDLQHLVTLPPLPLPALERQGPLTLATCLACLGWVEPALHFLHDAAGTPRPAFASGSARPTAEPAGSIREARVRLCVTPARYARQPWADADGQNLSRIGGRPSWVQDPVRRRCPQCRRPMAFLLQLDSELPLADATRWRWGSGGLLYVFWCSTCRLDTQLWQCT